MIRRTAARFKILAWIATLALVAGANAEEIAYRGKPVREWIDALRSHDVVVRRATALSLMTVAPGADALIPALGEALKDEDKEVRLTAVKALGALSHNFGEGFSQLRKALEGGDPQVRLEAVERLREISGANAISGSRDGPALQVPGEEFLALARVVNADADPVIRAAAAETLGSVYGSYRYGPDGSCTSCQQIGAEVLVEALKDAEAVVRRNAVEALGSVLGGTVGMTSAEAPAQALVDVLRDPNQDIRHRAAIVLSRIRPRPGSTIPLLAAVLSSDRDETIRRRAIDALQSNIYFIYNEERFKETIRSDREAAFAALIPALSDGDWYVRMHAAAALFDLGPAARPAVPALIVALKDPYHVNRQTVARCLARIGGDAKAAVPALVEVLQTDSSVRDDAARALQQIGPEAVRTASTALACELSEEKHSQRVQGIVDGLIALGPEGAQAAVGPLVGRLKDADPEFRLRVAENVGKLGPAGVASVPALVGALADPDDRVRASSASALGRIGPTASSASSDLEKLRDDNSESVRAAANAAVRQLNPSLESVPSLIARLGQEDPSGPYIHIVVQHLREMGKDALPAVPALVELMRSEGSGARFARMAAADALGEISREAGVATPVLVEAVKDKNSEVRRLAISALRVIGANSKPAAPVLIDALGDEDSQVRLASALCLSEIGLADRATVRVLVEELETTEGSAQHEQRLGELLRALSRIGPEVPGLTAAYIQLLRHPAVMARWAAAAGLAVPGSSPQPAIAALVRALEDEDPGTRRAAALSLGHIGSAAIPAVPAIAKLLFEESADVRAAAADALGQLGPGARQSVPALMRAAKDPAPQVRASAAAALGGIGPGAKMAVALLVSAALTDGIDQVRSSAATALWKVDLRGAASTPALILALREDATRRAATLVFRAIASSAIGATPHLAQALRDSVPEVQQTAAWALGKIGPGAKASVPALIIALSETAGPARVDFIQALGNIGPEAGAAVPAIVEVATTEKHEEVRREAAFALWRLGPEAVRAVPLLMEAVADEARRVAASSTLFAMDRRTQGVVPFLVRALDDPNYEIRKMAVMCLDRLESPGSEAVPALIRAMQDSDFGIRFSAVRTLGTIGPAARSAIPALLKARQDVRPEVRDIATQTLEKIGVAP